MDWDPPDAWTGMADYLRGLPASLPTAPASLLVISAHWESAAATVTTAPTPPLIYDYYGFPPHTYQLKWPAPGSPQLAARVQSLLAAAGIEHAADAARGFDHGVFVPLKLSWPEAQLPTVQLSLRQGLDPTEHLAIGRALAPLRDQGVLIVGSGMSYHNMRGFGHPSALGDSQKFDAWLTETVAAAPPERDARLDDWTRAPAARQCHPREEHLAPLFVVAGAAGDDRGVRRFAGEVLAVAVSAFHFG
jgi:aromatic ring-opening dioxygenase catalytic subunit (LigB family)